MNWSCDLQGKNPRDLLALFASVMAELRRQNVIRSSNNPVADYSEYLVAKALDLDLCKNSTAGFDAQSEDGTRYEVKGRRLTEFSKSRQLSAIRELESEKFDYLVGVLFAEDFTVKGACRLPHSTVMEHAKYISHTNSWALHLPDSLWGKEGVEDLTYLLRKAQ